MGRWRRHLQRRVVALASAAGIRAAAAVTAWRAPALHLLGMLAFHTGHPEEEIRRDIERDKILTSDEAKDYGLIDEVIKTRKSSRLASTSS